MAFEKELPQWKEKGVKPPQSKLDEGWKVQDKPPAAWLNWQMNKTYEALKEVQEKAAEKTDVTKTLKDAKDYTDQKVKDIDLSKITPESIGAAKQEDLTAHVRDNTKHVTEAERNAWNEKETPSGAQQKANAAENNAKNASLPRTGGTVTGDLTVTNTLTAAGRNVLWEIDSVKQSGVNAKQGTVDALNAQSVAASMNDEWPTLHTKIRQIPKAQVKLVERSMFIPSGTNHQEWLHTIDAGYNYASITNTARSEIMLNPVSRANIKFEIGGYAWDTFYWNQGSGEFGVRVYIQGINVDRHNRKIRISAGAKYYRQGGWEPEWVEPYTQTYDFHGDAPTYGTPINIGIYIAAGPTTSFAYHMLEIQSA